ncbi:MAG: hypothetical protein ABSB35_36325, partial [Bryobacteraceae bacterium]
MTRTSAIALGFFIASSLTWAADEPLPKAETVLDHYIEVTGGKEAYLQRKTEVSTGSFEIPAQGIKGTLTRYDADPDKSYAVVEIEGVGKIESGTGDGLAWERSLISGPRVLSGEEKAQALRENTFNAELNWRKIYSKVETTGVETVDGEECYKLVLTPKEGRPETTYYQKSTGLAVKMNTTLVSTMGELPVEATMGDYREFGGVLVATRITQKAAGTEVTRTIQTMKVNEEIPAGRFDLPADIKALLDKATAGAK